MSKQSYPRSKGRGKGKSPPFVRLFNRMIDSPNYAKLSGRAVKLLVDATRQYKGVNNGDLCLTRSVMRRWGWTSNDQLQKAILELEHYGFLVKSRQGGRNLASLYALTFHPIDCCSGKHELKETRKASNEWEIEQNEKPVFVKTLGRDTDQVGPQYGLVAGSNVVELSRHAGQYR